MKMEMWLRLISVSFARRDLTAFLWSMADLSKKQNETKEKAHVCEEFLVERFHWCLNPWNSFVSLIDSMLNFQVYSFSWEKNIICCQ